MSSKEKMFSEAEEQELAKCLLSYRDLGAEIVEVYVRYDAGNPAEKEDWGVDITHYNILKQDKAEASLRKWQHLKHRWLAGMYKLIWNFARSVFADPKYPKNGGFGYIVFKLPNASSSGSIWVGVSDKETPDEKYWRSWVSDSLPWFADRAQEEEKPLGKYEVVVACTVNCYGTVLVSAESEAEAERIVGADIDKYISEVQLEPDWQNMEGHRFVCAAQIQ